MMGEGGAEGMKGANESGLAVRFLTVGSSAPQGAQFQVYSVVIGTNLSSDWREKGEKEIEPKTGNM